MSLTPPDSPHPPPPLLPYQEPLHLPPHLDRGPAPAQLLTPRAQARVALPQLQRRHLLVRAWWDSSDCLQHCEESTERPRMWGTQACWEMLMTVILAGDRI